MKILFWLSIGLDRRTPSEHLLSDMIKALYADGHTVHILQKSTGGDNEYLPEMIRDLNIETTTIACHNARKTNFLHRYWVDIKYARDCKRWIKDHREFDRVFLQSSNVCGFQMSAIRKCLKNTPTVFNVQDIFPENLKFSGQLPLSKITYPIFSRLQRSAYKRADRLITISEDMKQTLVDVGVCADKIEVIHNWSYSDEPIELADMPREQIFDLNLDPTKTNVVYAGNIGRMQNVEVVAKAAVLSKDDGDVHYYIIGDGVNKRKVEEIVDGLPNVTVLPMQPSKYAESIYAQADINLIPLAKGGIQTALPSKTATVLRTNTYAVFCVGNGSLLEQRIGKISKVRFADNEHPEELYHVICELKKGKAEVDQNDQKEICSIFSRENAKQYAEIISQKTE